RLTALSPRLAVSRHLDLDANPRVRQPRRDHRGRGPDITQILFQDRPALREVLRLGKDVRHANHVSETRSGLLERRLDVSHGLLGLSTEVVRDRHRAVVEAGRARDEDPVAVDDGARVTDLGFERRARADESTSHRVFLLTLTEVQRVSLVVLDGEIPRASWGIALEIAMVGGRSVADDPSGSHRRTGRTDSLSRSTPCRPR